MVKFVSPALAAILALCPATAVSAAATSHIIMNKVQLYNFDDASVAVTSLDGTLMPVKSGEIVDLNNVSSYRISIKSGIVTIPPKTLTILMNRYILPRAQSPLSDVSMNFGVDVIHLRGKIRAAGVKLGFSADAYPFVLPNGDMGMRIEHLKTAGFIPGSLSDALGMTLERMAKPGKPGVMTVKGNVMAVSVSSTFPAPALEGRLSYVRVTPAGLATRIGSGKDTPDSPGIAITGGSVRFAHLVMPEAKLVIQPMKKQSDFGFSPRHYYQQMVGGSSKATTDFGLIGYFCDFRDIKSPN